MKLALALFLALLLPSAVAVAEQAPALEMVQVADGVFAFLPTDSAFETWRAASNSGAVVLDDGVLIYDSHWTPANFAEARELLREHTDKPIRYVVTSHHHGDHAGGLWGYPEDVEIITHHATRERLEKDFADLPERLPAVISGQEKQLETTEDPQLRARIENVLRYSRELLGRVESHQPEPLPTLTFDHKVTLHRGRKVEIYFLGRGHTNGDTVVYLPQEKVAFVGDLVFNRKIPNMNDGFSSDWIETLQGVLALGASHIVPGHGDVSTAAIVRTQIGYLKWVRGAVEPFVREGKTVEEALAAIELPEAYAGYRLPFYLRGNVAKVFGELSEEH